MRACFPVPVMDVGEKSFLTVDVLLGLPILELCARDLGSGAVRMRNRWSLNGESL